MTCSPTLLPLHFFPYTSFLINLFSFSCPYIPWQLNSLCTYNVALTEEGILRDTDRTEQAIVNSDPTAIVNNTSSIARRAHRILQVAQSEADNSEDPQYVARVNDTVNRLRNSECIDRYISYLWVHRYLLVSAHVYLFFSSFFPLNLLPYQFILADNTKINHIIIKLVSTLISISECTYIS